MVQFTLTTTRLIILAFLLNPISSRAFRKGDIQYVNHFSSLNFVKRSDPVPQTQRHVTQVTEDVTVPQWPSHISDMSPAHLTRFENEVNSKLGSLHQINQELGPHFSTRDQQLLPQDTATSHMETKLRWE